jgi:hypothetical protein
MLNESFTYLYNKYCDNENNNHLIHTQKLVHFNKQIELFFNCY